MTFHQMFYIGYFVYLLAFILAYFLTPIQYGLISMVILSLLFVLYCFLIAKKYFHKHSHKKRIVQ